MVEVVHAEITPGQPWVQVPLTEARAKGYKHYHMGKLYKGTELYVTPTPTPMPPPAPPPTLPPPTEPPKRVKMEVIVPAGGLGAYQVVKTYPVPVIVTKEGEPPKEVPAGTPITVEKKTVVPGYAPTKEEVAGVKPIPKIPITQEKVYYKVENSAKTEITKAEYERIRKEPVEVAPITSYDPEFKVTPERQFWIAVKTAPERFLKGVAETAAKLVSVPEYEKVPTIKEMAKREEAVRIATTMPPMVTIEPEVTALIPLPAVYQISKLITEDIPKIKITGVPKYLVKESFPEWKPFIPTRKWERVGAAIGEVAITTAMLVGTKVLARGIAEVKAWKIRKELKKYGAEYIKVEVGKMPKEKWKPVIVKPKEKLTQAIGFLGKRAQVAITRPRMLMGIALISPIKYAPIITLGVGLAGMVGIKEVTKAEARLMPPRLKEEVTLREVAPAKVVQRQMQMERTITRQVTKIAVTPKITERARIARTWSTWAMPTAIGISEKQITKTTTAQEQSISTGVITAQKLGLRVDVKLREFPRPFEPLIRKRRKPKIKKIKKKRRKRYIPSYKAVAYGIYGRKPKVLREYRIEELRPIPYSYKKIMGGITMKKKKKRKKKRR